MNNEFNISKNSAFTKIIKKDKLEEKNLDIRENYTDDIFGQYINLDNDNNLDDCYDKIIYNKEIKIKETEDDEKSNEVKIEIHEDNEDNKVETENNEVEVETENNKVETENNEVETEIKKNNFEKYFKKENLEEALLIFSFITYLLFTLLLITYIIFGIIFLINDYRNFKESKKKNLWIFLLTSLLFISVYICCCNCSLLGAINSVNNIAIITSGEIKCSICCNSFTILIFFTLIIIILIEILNNSKEIENTDLYLYAKFTIGLEVFLSVILGIYCYLRYKYTDFEYVDNLLLD